MKRTYHLHTCKINLSEMVWYFIGVYIKKGHYMVAWGYKIIISLSVEKYFLTWEETFHISLPPYTILYIYVRCDTTFSGKFKDKLCLHVSILWLVLSLQKWQNRWTSYSKPRWGRNYISKTLLKSFQKWPISKFNIF